MARASTAAVRLLTGEREPVRLATTANIDTNDRGFIQGLKTIDGVLTEVGDRVLVKDQTNQKQNGIYTSSEGIWYRASDARSARTMQKGTTVHVQLGLTNAGNVYSFQTDEPNVGEDNIVLALYMTDNAGQAILDARDDAEAAATAAGSSATAASGSASSASTSASNAAASASTASTAATNAGNSATAASGSASAASTAATNASNSASAAATSATSAGNAKTAAEAAQAAAEAAAAGVNLPSIQPGDAGKTLLVNEDEDGYELGSGGGGSGIQPTDTDASGFGFVNSAGALGDSDEKLPSESVVKAYVDNYQRKQLDIFVTSDHQIYNNEAQEGYLADVLADIAALTPNAVFMLGDLVDQGDEGFAAPTSTQGFLWGDYFDALYASGIPIETWYSIAGNHDMASSASDSPTVLNMGVGYYKRTRRPPMYALTCGNMAFIFCGYEGTKSVEQVMSPLWMDQVEALLKQFQHTHNIILCTHAPLYEAGLFDFKPSTEWFRLKPQSRWLSLFDTYPIDAHFCGHSATDIITADESADGAVRPTSDDPDGGPWKTYTTRTGTNGHTSSFFLTGPHIEQKHWEAGHKLGGLRITLSDGATAFPVDMRDHLAAAWVAAKARSVNVRFPIRLGERLEEFGGLAIAPSVPALNAPLRIQVGRAEPNALGASGVDTRKIASIADWVDWRQGDLAHPTDFLHQINMPTDDPAATAVGSLKIGARRVHATDSNLATEFVLFGTDASGGEVPILLPAHQTNPEAAGQYIFQGGRYVTSALYPMWDLRFAGSTGQADPKTITYTSVIYDDFTQVVLGTGVYTCTRAGVYNCSAQVQFNGHASAFEDVVTLKFVRTRGGVDADFGAMDFRLEGTNANSRQVLQIDALIGVLGADTVKVVVAGWASGNMHTITRASFKGVLARGV